MKMDEEQLDIPRFSIPERDDADIMDKHEEKDRSFKPLSRKDIQHQLVTTLREMSFMKDYLIECHIKDNNFEIKFDRFSWCEDTKYHIVITINKIPLPKEL
jgi:hypothetical protein